MKIKLSKPKTKNFSRDSTPLTKTANKSTDTSLKQNYFSEHSISNSSQLQKRNQRTNSFGFNHTETHLQCSIKHFPFQQSLQTKPLSRKKSKNNFINRSIPSWSKVSLNIPFRNDIKKSTTKKTKLTLNKMTNSTKNNILQHSFIITSSNIHRRFNTNSNNNNNNKSNNSKCIYEPNSLEYNSENVSCDRKETINIKELGKKLNQIQNNIFNLIRNSPSVYKGIILDELDKIYKSVLIYSNNNIEHIIPKNKNNYTDIYNIEFLLIENENIRMQNNQLNKKIEIIELKWNKVVKDNEMLKKDISRNKEIIELLQDNVKNINQELLKIKFEKEIVSKKDIYYSMSNTNRSEEETLDNISLGDNVNVKIMSKLKGNAVNINNNNNNNSTAPGSTGVQGIPNTKLQLNLPKTIDFNKEFLDKYEEFSPSWRKEADKMLNKRSKK